MMYTEAERETRWAMGLSVAAGLVMLAIKFGAYLHTGSMAILGDAAESVVHVMAVLFAAYSLWLSSKPADAQHPYGHAKISFFSAGAEGALIVVAAVYIAYAAISEWQSGLSLRNPGIGAALTALAALINAWLGVYLMRVGRRRRSLILEANGRHVLTDSWTSFGVVAGLLLAWGTGWMVLDPLCAILVAVHIMYSGFQLLRRSVGGLMDQADPAVQQQLTEVLDQECQRLGISHHLMRQRYNGFSYDVDVHLMFPDSMPIRDAHRIATGVEHAIQKALPPSAHVTTHLEPRDDHRNIHPGASVDD